MIYPVVCKSKCDYMTCCCTWSFFFFPFIFISRRLITSQHFSRFCHTLTWISHGATCIPHPGPPSTSLSTRFLWVFPVHQARALVSCIPPGLVICFTLDNIHAVLWSYCLCTWDNLPVQTLGASLLEKDLWYSPIHVFRVLGIKNSYHLYPYNFLITIPISSSKILDRLPHGTGMEKWGWI